MMKDRQPSSEACLSSINAVKDALYVLSGKWKLPLIVSLINGPKRFNEIQRSLSEITPKVLSKELREMELNGFVERKVFDTFPVTVIYELTDYSDTLGPIIDALSIWGTQHRKRIVEMRRLEPVTT